MLHNAIPVQPRLDATFEHHVFGVGDTWSRLNANAKHVAGTVQLEDLQRVRSGGPEVVNLEAGFQQSVFEDALVVERRED
jgi:hypothetical protein